ncbi:MAG: hypothetical protein IT436_12605 [Phycisphaerales bacterium]|nr:hypothetical protein [Phycisphaerales bacterium]
MRTRMNAGEADARGRGRPGTRLSWWRRAILFVLEVNPPWWGLARLWAFVLLLLAIGIDSIGGPDQLSTEGVTFVYVLNADGQWALNRYGGGYIAVVEFCAAVEHHQGDGWDRWDVEPVTVRQTYPDSSGSYIRDIDSIDARRLGFAAASDALDIQARTADRRRGDNVEGARQMMIVGHMVRDGRSTYIEGMRSYLLWLASRIGVWLSITGMVMSLGVGSLRVLARFEYDRRLQRIRNCRCPMCCYDMSAAAARVCPECGADVEAVEREARAALE